MFVESLEGRSLLSGGPGLRPGSLDPGFGTGGVASPPAIFGPTDDIASGVAIQRQGDGKIVVAGTARGVEGPSAFAVARYNADGSLDVGFGNGGTTFTPFPSGSVQASAVATQSDGKVVVAGTFQGDVNGSSVEEFALARYTKDGILDKSFGIGGEVITDFGTDSFSSASSVAITPGGQIVVSGPVTIGGVNDFAVARYDSNGKLDKSFGIGGEATAGFPNLTVFLNPVDLALQPDGKVVLAGTVADFSGGFKTDFGLARFGTNGRLDATFGTGGEVVTSFGATNVSSVAGVALEPGTNAIVVAGTVQDPSTFAGEFALARYKASDGSLDATFGNGGEVVTPAASGTTTTAAGVAIQADGKIVVEGATSGFDASSNFFQDLALARYTLTGQLDKTFGTGGQILTDFGTGSRSTGAGVAIQPDGKIVGAGSVSFPFSGGPVAGFGVARYTSSGGLDRGFGVKGKVITNVAGPTSDVAAGVAIQPDGKIVELGTASVFAANGTIIGDFALTRFKADGTVDTHFGTNGSVLTSFGDGSIQAVGVTVQADGRIVVAGTLTNAEFVQEIVLARYTKDGILDSSFGTGGEVLTTFGGDTSATAAGVTIDPTGRIVVAATVSGFDSSDNFFEDFAVARYRTNGSLDASFGSGGEALADFGSGVSATAAGVAIAPGGKIVVAGSITDPNTFNNDFAVARFNASGSLDTSFGSGGEATASFGPDTSDTAVGVAVQADGKIIVAGTDQDFDTNFIDEFGLARFNANGSLDATFGTGGLVATSFGPSASAFAGGVTIQPDGRIVVAGTVQDFATDVISEFGLARYDTNGSLDASFGSGGLVTTSFGPGTSASAAGVAIGSDGEIIVAGTITDSNFGSNLTLAGYVGSKRKDRK
jgi:uncharacterized delta-60 repeat protein